MNTSLMSVTLFFPPTLLWGVLPQAEFWFLPASCSVPIWRDRHWNEAVCFSETPINFYENTRLDIATDNVSYPNLRAPGS
jgi:hypothetical protein